MSTLNKNILVRDVMLHTDRFPVILETVIFKEALVEMVRTRIGIVCVVNQGCKLVGILTDGDIRRKLLTVQKPLSALHVDDALDHAIRMPTTIFPLDTINHAVEIMGDKQVWDLPVIDEEGILVGLLNLHAAVKAILNLRN
jgi:CBS domain-containing protein